NEHSVWGSITRDGDGRGEQPGERSGRDIYGSGERGQWDLRWRGEHGDDDQWCGDDGGVHGERDRRRPVQRRSQRGGSDLCKLLTDEQIDAGGNGPDEERLTAEPAHHHGVPRPICRDGDGRREQPGERSHRDVYGSGERSQWDLRWRGEHGDDEYQWCSDV